MKCRITRIHNVTFKPQVRRWGIWFSIKVCARNNPYMNDSRFNITYSSLESAKEALIDFAEEYRKTKDKKPKTVFEDDIASLEFVEKI